jgi:hypothetical protein
VKPVKIHDDHPPTDLKEKNAGALASMQQALAQERKSCPSIHHTLGCL